MTAPTTFCPAWCVSDHLASTTVHFQADAHIPTASIHPLPVGAQLTGDRPAIVVGGYELSPEQADELVLYLTDRIALVRETLEDAR